MNENPINENLSETALPAESCRIYHAQEAPGQRQKRDNPIYIRALIFGALAALAVFTADIPGRGNNADNVNSAENPPLSGTADSMQEQDSSGRQQDAYGENTGNPAENSPNGSYEAPKENTAANIFKSLSEKIGQAAEILSLGAAKAELWSFSESINYARQKFDVIFENNENISADRGNTNPVTGGSLTLLGDDSGILSRGVRRMPSSADEEGDVSESPLPKAFGDSSPLPYTSCGDEAGGDILRQTYRSYSGEAYINLPLAGQLRNVTSLSSDEILAACNTAPDYKIELNSPLPQVLIMHTHTTETYEKTERARYDSDFLSRTTDSDMNMTAVGRAMAKVLCDSGINTIHDVTVHDYPSYNGSYDRSRETVERILRENPSIKVVLDIHRDAIERADGTRVAPYADINGKSAAQIMIICGCDDGTMGMPDCMKNLRTASLFEQYIESGSPGLTRPLLFDYRKYNQDITTGSLLIEVGGHANSIDEAVFAGELAAKGIAEALKSISE